MDKKIKLIYSEKYNQFYSVLRVDEDVGVYYIKLTKNHYDKAIKRREILRIEQNSNYIYCVMYDVNITSEQHFIRIMDSNINVQSKIGELKNFKKNMLIDSEIAMQRLKELSECIENLNEDDEMKKLQRVALELYTSITPQQIITDNKSTYVDQMIPSDIKKMALSKRLFVERSDDYYGNKEHRHPSTKADRLVKQERYPCGFIIKDRYGVVIAGNKYDLSLENAIEFIKYYVPTANTNYHKKLYLVPMSLRKKRQLAICYDILKKRGLYCKNEHNYYFWVLDRNNKVIAGGQNGFGFKWLLKYCNRLNTQKLQKDKVEAINNKRRINR